MQGAFKELFVICFHTNAYVVLATLLHLKECSFGIGVYFTMKQVSPFVCVQLVLNRFFLYIMIKNRNGL